MRMVGRIGRGIDASGTPDRTAGRRARRSRHVAASERRHDRRQRAPAARPPGDDRRRVGRRRAGAAARARRAARRRADACGHGPANGSTGRPSGRWRRSCRPSPSPPSWPPPPRRSPHSRARIAVARDEERRALRRELHDGLGPALAGVTYGLMAARNLMTTDPAAAGALLDQMVGRARCPHRGRPHAGPRARAAGAARGGSAGGARRAGRTPPAGRARRRARRSASCRPSCRRR